MALRLKPGYAKAHVKVGNALAAQVEQAVAVWRLALRPKPDSADAHTALGSALGQEGRLVEAVAELRAAIRLKPDYADAHVRLGLALQTQGMLDEAVAEYREAIRLKPDLAQAHVNLGITLEAQGKLAEAVAEYRTAIRLKPDDPGAHRSLACALVGSPDHPWRDYGEGLVHARKAFEMAPKDGNIYNTLALAEYRAGHWNESIAAGERSMALRNGGNADDWFFLALARWQKGDTDEACKWFDKAVAWTKEKAPENVKLRRFWAEAAGLLGQPKPDAEGQSRPATPKAEKPH